MAAPAESAQTAFPPPFFAALRIPGAVLEAMRPKQWVKNVFVFAGVAFAGQLFDATASARALICFAIFCAASSAVYLINDSFDRVTDLHHPTKRFRPIASGRLPVPVAVAAALLLGAAAIGGAIALSRITFLILALYLASSFSYTAGLKRVFILDALLVASGFVLRAAAGAAAVNAEISPWLICCTFLLALYLALGKRRHELGLLGASAQQHRKNLGTYSVPLLDSWLTALSGATIVCYALYTQAARTVQNFHTTNLLYTVPFVVYALFRYQHLVLRENEGGDPGSSLLRDRGMVIAIAGWAAVAGVIVYRR
ncbi:MAG TPA: decaprenyl-phosphate phosphoribosyltransferase [Myxococcales bacterium]|nr:decaprenyl-phosphate phosphoribosyltransferase [Myxococcales bacterium]